MDTSTTQMETTNDIVITTESIAVVATKIYTVYFLVTGICMGLLLFIGIRKASKICCWHCMYGSKYIRDEKADPRVPKTLFRTPSVLTTLQSHYDKGRKHSFNSITTGTSLGYAATLDLERGTSRDIENVHRYLDNESDGETHVVTTNSQSTTLERVEIVSEDPGDEDISSKEDTFNQKESIHVHHEKRSSTLSHDEVRADFLDADIDTTSNVSDSTAEHRVVQENDLSKNVPAAPSDEGTSAIQPAVLEMHSLNEPVYSTTGKYSSTSELSITDDGAPLVSIDKGGKNISGVSARKGRFKKNISMTVSSGASFGSASAKSSKRYSRH